MEHEVKERIPWIPVAVVTIVVGFAHIMWTMMQPGGGVAAWYSIGIVGGMLYFMPLPYVALLVLAAISKTKLFGDVKPSIFTYIYSCLTPLAFSGVYDAVFVPASYWADRYLSSLSMELEPWFFAPEPEIAEQILTGGVPIPWAEWLPSILWWWTIFSLWAFFFISLGTIMRRHWVDVEKVPFPQTVVAHEIVKMAEKDKEGAASIKWISAGMSVGLAFSLVLFMILLFPWFPDVLGWRVNTCTCSGATFITTDSPFINVVALTTFQKNPLYPAILYLAPVNILFNIWFWSIVVIILTQVAYALGYYTAATTVGGCGRGYCGEASVFTNPPFLWAVFGDLGVALGIFFTYWILNRGYFRDTVIAAIGKGSLAEAEKDEAIPYRIAYATLLASFVLILVAFMAASLSILPALMLFFATLFYGFLWTRMWGLTGYMSPTGFYTAVAFMKPIWPHPPEPRTMEWTVAMGFVVMPASNVAYEGWGHPLLAMISNYRLASLTGTSPRNVLKVTVFSAVLAPLLAMLSLIIGSYAFGLTRLQGAGMGTWGPTDRFTPEFTENWPARTTWWPNMLLGFVVAFLLNYLHARYVWFPFNAIGFLLGTDMWSVVPAVWQAALIAWVLKTLTLRIGGSKTYEAFGRPVAAGFLIGFAIMCFVGGAVGIVRFFFPF
ncbi:MAG: hypothetical protein JTT11_05285 [Candidatus Brockarchaeota archaeon]|nr:hypothetical protein [Candidatus Brockarchaeota archaeon]